MTRPILSVARLAEAGRQARFHKDGGSIVHKQSGYEITFARHRGVYVLEAQASALPELAVIPKPGFPRQDSRDTLCQRRP